MEIAQNIRQSLGQVTTLRQLRRDDPSLGSAVLAVKRLQAKRFAGTYHDMLAGGAHREGARFFLHELYGDKDYTERDAQFARIAGTVQTLFPQSVSGVALALAQLHALTEHLDHALAAAWLRDADTGATLDAASYVVAWRVLGQREQREDQLRSVMRIGQELAQFTRKPGLRLMLKMMRGAALASGLESLQRFLEGGFDTFGAMARRRGCVEEFLSTVEQREAALIAMLFDAETDASQVALTRALDAAAQH